MYIILSPETDSMYWREEHRFPEAYGKHSKTTCWEGKKSEKEDFILGSSHVRESGPMLKEHLGTAYEITSNFKHNAHLTNVAEDMGKLGNNLIKPDHIIIVGEPGKSLGRNYHYSNEEGMTRLGEYTGRCGV